LHLQPPPPATTIAVFDPSTYTPPEFDEPTSQPHYTHPSEFSHYSHHEQPESHYATPQDVATPVPVVDGGYSPAPESTQSGWHPASQVQGYTARAMNMDKDQVAMEKNAVKNEIRGICQEQQGCDVGDLGEIEEVRSFVCEDLPMPQTHDSYFDELCAAV
jgi:hypothetical protein